LDVVSLILFFPIDQFSVVFERFCVNYIFEKFITLAARLPYSRRLEEEADAVGLMLAAKVNEEYF